MATIDLATIATPLLLSMLRDIESRVIRSGRRQPPAGEKARLVIAGREIVAELWARGARVEWSEEGTQ